MAGKTTDGPATVPGTGTVAGPKLRQKAEVKRQKHRKVTIEEDSPSFAEETCCGFVTLLGQELRRIFSIG